ncbi:hypothetical protein [Halostagnicola kamekurae]|uniref:hypothetical protein n=1 Tax=Halostagnicola kamekurae TaxID=619731 RepID=UPI001C314669|nr:hypothetical protein [Halostagnicola kamekurae]
MLFGSLVLFVPLTVVTILVAADTLWIVGTSALLQNELAYAAVCLLALGFGYVTAMEICRVRLHGFDQLHRGTRPRRLARHGVLGVVSVAAAIALGRILLDAISVGFANGDPEIIGLGVAGLLALSWVGVRSLSAFRAGTRRFRDGAAE